MSPDGPARNTGNRDMDRLRAKYPNLDHTHLIEMVYDLEAGSYTEQLADPARRKFKTWYGRAMANEILAHGAPTSVLDAGIGEATTLSFVLSRLVPRLEGLGATVHKHELLSQVTNPLNPTAVITATPPIETVSPREDLQFVCPLTHSELKEIANGFLWSEAATGAYPMLDGVPCLRPGHRITASVFQP